MYEGLPPINGLSWYLVSLFAGCILATVLFLIYPREEKAKVVSDFLWIFFGGLGAFTAILFASFSIEKENILKQKSDLAASGRNIFEQSMRFFENACVPVPAYILDSNEGSRDALCYELTAKLAETLGKGSLASSLSKLQAEEIFTTGINSEISRDETKCTISDSFISKSECNNLMMKMPRFRYFPENELFDIKANSETHRRSQIDGLDPFITPSSAFANKTSEEIAIFLLSTQFGQPAVAEHYSRIKIALGELDLESKSFAEKINTVRGSAYKAWLRFLSLCTLAFAFPMRLGKSVADLKRAYIRKHSKP